MRERMDCFVAENCDTVVPAMVELLSEVAGQVSCLECDGIGFWPWHPDGRMLRCTNCKGTGKVYVSV